MTHLSADGTMLSVSTHATIIRLLPIVEVEIKAIRQPIVISLSAQRMLTDIQVHDFARKGGLIK